MIGVTTCHLWIRDKSLRFQHMESCMSYNKITCDQRYASIRSWSYLAPANLVIEIIGLPREPLAKDVNRCKSIDCLIHIC